MYRRPDRRPPPPRHGPRPGAQCVTRSAAATGQSVARTALLAESACRYRGRSHAPTLGDAVGRPVDCPARGDPGSSVFRDASQAHEAARAPAARSRILSAQANSSAPGSPCSASQASTPANPASTTSARSAAAVSHADRPHDAEPALTAWAAIVSSKATDSFERSSRQSITAFLQQAHAGWHPHSHSRGQRDRGKGSAARGQGSGPGGACLAVEDSWTVEDSWARRTRQRASGPCRSAITSNIASATFDVAPGAAAVEDALAWAAGSTLTVVNGLPVVTNWSSVPVVGSQIRTL